MYFSGSKQITLKQEIELALMEFDFVNNKNTWEQDLELMFETKKITYSFFDLVQYDTISKNAKFVEKLLSICWKVNCLAKWIDESDSNLITVNLFKHSHNNYFYFIKQEILEFLAINQHLLENENILMYKKDYIVYFIINGRQISFHSPFADDWFWDCIEYRNIPWTNRYNNIFPKSDTFDTSDFPITKLEILLLLGKYKAIENASESYLYNPYLGEI